MREIRSYGSEGGGIETNRCFLPLSVTTGAAFVLRDNLDENGASIWMRRGGRAERQLTMAAVLARL